MLDGKREVATSSSRFSTTAEAKKAIKQFRDEAPVALIPIVHTFRIEEPLPTWGLPLRLQALVPPTFGGVEGLVFLQGPTQTRALKLEDWEGTPGTVVALLRSSRFPVRISSSWSRR